VPDSLRSVNYLRLQLTARLTIMTAQTERHPDQAGSMQAKDDAFDTINGTSAAGFGRRSYLSR